MLKHHCEATHVESLFVREVLNDSQLIWEGDVEVFELTGHNRSHLCYAWGHCDATGIKFTTVLGNFFINSAQKAVQSALFIGAEHPQVQENFGQSRRDNHFPEVERFGDVDVPRHEFQFDLPPHEPPRK